MTTFQKVTKPKAVEEFLDFYFYRRVAMLLVPVFHKLKITPNVVTWMSLFLGLFAAFLVYKTYFVYGAIVYMFSIFFDCADGQLARLTGQSTPAGRALDGFADLVCVVFLWVAIYLSDIFSVYENWQVLVFIAVTGLWTLIHCFRYDNVKLKYIKLVELNYSEKSLNARECLAQAKKEWQAFHPFSAFIMLGMAIQQYVFVSGKKQEKQIELSDQERQQINKELSPIMNFWSWLGVGHHNTIIILGLFFTPWSYYALLVAFAFILVPANLYYFWGEYRFYKSYKAIIQKYKIA